MWAYRWGIRNWVQGGKDEGVGFKWDCGEHELKERAAKGSVLPYAPEMTGAGTQVVEWVKLGLVWIS